MLRLMRNGNIYDTVEETVMDKNSILHRLLYHIELEEGFSLTSITRTLNVYPMLRLVLEDADKFMEMYSSHTPKFNDADEDNINFKALKMRNDVSVRQLELTPYTRLETSEEKSSRDAIMGRFVTTYTDKPENGVEDRYSLLGYTGEIDEDYGEVVDGYSLSFTPYSTIATLPIELMPKTLYVFKGIANEERDNMSHEREEYACGEAEITLHMFLHTCLEDVTFFGNDELKEEVFNEIIAQKDEVIKQLEEEKSSDDEEKKGEVLPFKRKE